MNRILRAIASALLQNDIHVSVTNRHAADTAPRKTEQLHISNTTLKIDACVTKRVKSTLEDHRRIGPVGYFGNDRCNGCIRVRPANRYHWQLHDTYLQRICNLAIERRTRMLKLSGMLHLSPDALWFRRLAELTRRTYLFKSASQKIEKY
jgi:hypothetical protein